MANCPKCGAQASGKFCPSCGAPMPQEQVAAAPMPIPPQPPQNFPPQPSMPPQAPVQPGFSQQPGYPPQQPGYPPQQPGYQPGYQQPGFAPVQPKKTNFLLWLGVGLGLGLLIVVLVLVLDGGDKGGGSNLPANSVGQVVITNSVDPETQAPGQALTTVPASTNPIFAAVQVNTDKPSQLLAKWSVDGVHVPTLDTPIDVEEGSGWVSFQIKFQGNWPAATYKVEVFLDGQKVQEKSFQVQ